MAAKFTYYLAQLLQTFSGNIHVQFTFGGSNCASCAGIERDNCCTFVETYGFYSSAVIDVHCIILQLKFHLRAVYLLKSYIIFACKIVIVKLELFFCLFVIGWYQPFWHIFSCDNKNKLLLIVGTSFIFI